MATKVRGKGTKRRQGANMAERFSLNRATEAVYEGEGLRPYFRYRDLGIKRATGGRVGAHIIRAARACTEGTGAHKHKLELQIIYVLKGEVAFWYDGQGEFVLRPGDCVHMPAAIHHELIRGSSDLEMLEITAPAEFATIDVKRIRSKTAPKRTTAKAKVRARAKKATAPARARAA
jgi:quercetin dioxygenase-like cupin family protein